MRFKAGLIIGFVAGFIVGARAGKERYDRLVASIRRALADERVQQATDLAERSTRKTRAAAGSGLVSVATTVREKAAAP
jgi:DNA-binding SARP family transcriptional activator